MDRGEFDKFKNHHHHHHVEMLKELDFIKKELNKLKLDTDSVLEEKSRADKETKASSSTMEYYTKSAENLRNEINEVNEEHILIELARIEARRELELIEAQKEKEFNKFSSELEGNKKKINEITQEIDRLNVLEIKLADTLSDVNVLQNELKQLEEIDEIRLLGSIRDELESAKKDLAAIRDGGFLLMTSMDVLREELKRVIEETSQMRKTEQETELNIKNLNTKLIKTKSRLESAYAAEEKSKEILSNLSRTLQHFELESEATKLENEIISNQIKSINEDIMKTESEIDLFEEDFQIAMQELEKVKSSEKIAFEKLKSITENTMKSRADASKHSSTITISNFEIEYITGRANEAKQISDKKIEAAQAWIEALKASEKEILMKTEIAKREVEAEKSLPAKLENMQQVDTARRTRGRKSASALIRYTPRSTSVTLRKRTKIMPNLSKILSGQTDEK